MTSICDAFIVVGKEGRKEKDENEEEEMKIDEFVAHWVVLHAFMNET